ncbi:MAG: CPBP family intramembrane metalloprotease [Deltaproteobacteria bacterium]|nr:CPBP family intramembrane metalloprotease [Deltaproteobacteria bacterium]
MDSAKTTIGPINAGTLTMVVLGLAAVEIALRTMSRPNMVSPLLLLGVGRLIEGALIIGVALMGKDGLSVVGISKGTALSGFLRGLLWSAGFGVLVVLVFVSLLSMGTDPLPFIKTPLPLMAGEFILFFLVGGIISPVTEELFFRGVVYGFLRRWGAVSAVVFSSLAFVLAHHTAFTGTVFIQLTGGIVFASAYEIEKKLMVPITLHVLGNLAIFVLSSLSA